MSPAIPGPDESETHPNGVRIGSGAQVQVGGDIVAGDKIAYASKSDLRERRNQLILAEKVKISWVKGVLEKSVHSAALIELGKEIKANAVEHPWDMVLERPDGQSQSLPAGKKIVEIFDGMGRALLILGAPGSGKTITLLELARDLIARAESDPVHPIPVVLNLSSWAKRRQPLADWLADELSVKYQIPRMIGRKWITDIDLCLLLDGLDEVAAEYRGACVAAINGFRADHGLTELAITCRAEDYRALAAKLDVSGTMTLQPLTDEQIVGYLADFGAKLAALYKMMRIDPFLRKLAQSPLMLSVMSLAYADVSVADLSRTDYRTSAERRKHIFDVYVERMFERVGKLKSAPYPREQTIRWLSWLAREQLKHGQSVFLIEQIQPSWLESGVGKWVYVVTTRLLVGLLIAFSVSVFGLRPITATPLDTAHVTLQVFLVEMFMRLIGVRPMLPTSLSMLYLVVQITLLVLFIGLTVGGMFAVLGGLRLQSKSAPKQVRGPLFDVAVTTVGIGFVITLIAWVINGMAGIMLYGDSLAQAALFAVIFNLPRALVGGASFGVVFGLRRPERYTDDVRPFEAVSWSWSEAITGCLRTAFVGAIISMIGGGLAGTVYGFIYAAVKNLSGGPDSSTLPWLAYPAVAGVGLGLLFLLAGALVGGLLGGLIRGLRSVRVEARSQTNQGIRQSLENAVAIGPIFWIGGGLILSLVFGVIIGSIPEFHQEAVTPEYDLMRGLIRNLLASPMVGVSSGLSIGLLGALWFGGLAVIQHYTLRVLLSHTEQIPFNLTRFLDYAAERIFLRKVGGGYIFIHRLIMEYFAELEPLNH